MSDYNPYTKNGSLVEMRVLMPILDKSDIFVDRSIAVTSPMEKVQFSNKLCNYCDPIQDGDFLKFIVMFYDPDTKNNMKGWYSFSSKVLTIVL